MSSCIFGDPSQLCQFVYLEVPVNNVQVRYPFTPYEVCDQQIEKPEHLFSKPFYFFTYFLCQYIWNPFFPLLGEGWKQKSIIFIFQLTPFYIMYPYTLWLQF